jgi:hypothetical protein
MYRRKTACRLLLLFYGGKPVFHALRAGKILPTNRPAFRPRGGEPVFLLRPSSFIPKSKNNDLQRFPKPKKKTYINFSKPKISTYSQTAHSKCPLSRLKPAFFHTCFTYVLLYFYSVLYMFYMILFIFCYTFFNIYQLNLTVKLYQICP